MNIKKNSYFKMKTACILLIALFFFESAYSQNILNVNSNHLSIDIKVYDKGSFYYVELTNNSNTTLEIEVSLQINTKCGETKTYTNTRTLLSQKSNNDGWFSGNISTNKDCKGGLESAILNNIKVTDITPKSVEKETPNNSNNNSSTSNNSPSNSSSYSNSSPETRYNTNPQITEQVNRQNRLNELQKEQNQQKFNQQKWAEEQEIKSKQYKEEQQKTEKIVVEGMYGLANTWMEARQERLEREEREEQRKREQEFKRQEAERRRIEEERIKKELYEANIANRKLIISEFNANEIPLSSEKVNSNKIYFFIYSYNPSTLNNEFTDIYISNVFEIGQYQDGTWPYQYLINNEIADLTPNAEVLHGYYLSETEALNFQQTFINLFSANTGVNLIYFQYKGKPTTNSQTETMPSTENSGSYFGESFSDKNKTTNPKENNFAPAIINDSKPTENTGVNRENQNALGEKLKPRKPKTKK